MEGMKMKQSCKSPDCTGSGQHDKDDSKQTEFEDSKVSSSAQDGAQS